MTTGSASVQVHFDSESRLAHGDHEALRLWLRLRTCTSLIAPSVRSGPRRDFRCTLPCFDLLSQLERHPGGLRMGGLSRRMMVTGGNVTGFADQLVKEGLVTREALLDDRCAFVVRLTPAGRKALLRMAEAHEARVVRLCAGLSGPERRQLHARRAKLKASVSSSARSAVA